MHELNPKHSGREEHPPGLNYFHRDKLPTPEAWGDAEHRLEVTKHYRPAIRDRLFTHFLTGLTFGEVSTITVMPSINTIVYRRDEQNAVRFDTNKDAVQALLQAVLKESDEKSTKAVAGYFAVPPDIPIDPDRERGVEPFVQWYREGDSSVGVEDSPKKLLDPNFKWVFYLSNNAFPQGVPDSVVNRKLRAIGSEETEAQQERAQEEAAPSEDPIAVDDYTPMPSRWIAIEYQVNALLGAHYIGQYAYEHVCYNGKRNYIEVR
ncbi:MAG: hypothetical protein KDD70_18155, partial [Bdellovibrionales bacterium]|nr:hypothetical protein [Bdellovibrionales bacterium]